MITNEQLDYARRAVEAQRIIVDLAHEKWKIALKGYVRLLSVGYGPNSANVKAQILFAKEMKEVWQVEVIFLQEITARMLHYQDAIAQRDIVASRLMADGVDVSAAEARALEVTEQAETRSAVIKMSAGVIALAFVVTAILWARKRFKK